MRPHFTIEPVTLSAALPVRVEHVRRAPGLPAPERFAHFHPVAEIVLFRQVEGAMFTDASRFELAPGCATWMPAMNAHDFEIAPGVAHWTLIQFYQDFAQVQPQASAMCVVPDADAREQLQTLSIWLEQAAQRGFVQKAQRCLDLILLTLEQAQPLSATGVTPSHALARFGPLLESLRASPGANLSLSQAASLCHLSPSYFSRLFRDVFGRGFADYVTEMKLDHAAMLLATTQEPVSAVGFRAGFSSHAYFTAQFRQRFGCTPSAFRRQASQRA